jgi:alpha-L-fucosidase 2
VSGINLPGTTICAGSSIDMEILSDLFGYFITAAQTLKTDTSLARQVISARARLRPPLVGKDSLLQEWTEDWGQLEKQHRHLSPLYGLYPGNVFSITKTPAFTTAIKQTLEERGDAGPGFSITWKMALWARLFDGNRAYSLFKGYLKNQCFPTLFAKGGTQFQVDGVFGAAAGITEMLVQSQEGIIRLLPALPDQWSEGELNGMRLRRGFELNMKWKNKSITHAEILSGSGQPCRVTAATAFTITCNGKTIKAQKAKDGSMEFPTTRGNVYVLIAKEVDR